MSDKIIDNLKGFFSKKFRKKLKDATIDEMIERMDKKAQKLSKKLASCEKDDEADWLKKQIVVLQAQIDKAKSLKKK